LSARRRRHIRLIEENFQNSPRIDEGKGEERTLCLEKVSKDFIGSAEKELVLDLLQLGLACLSKLGLVFRAVRGARLDLVE
jgi:hypothetical protein